MKAFKLALMVVVAGLLALGISTQSQAFHSGGVAECEGCHTMHNSLDGQAMVEGTTQYAAPGPFLLKYSTQSDTCLECHAEAAAGSYHILSSVASGTFGPAAPATDAPYQFTPGGDFAWMKRSYTWIPRGTAVNSSLAERHGHNTIAPDHGIDPDGTITQSPGGSFPANQLGCQSCHDPHGRYRRLNNDSISTTGAPIRASGSYYNAKSGVAANEPNSWSAVGVYRILGGNGYSPKSLAGAHSFTQGPPVAKVNSTYNLTAGEPTVAAQLRTAYGAGMSEWCGNCHGSMHRDTYTSGTSGLTHPAGNGAKLTDAIAANYNAYVKSGDMSGSSLTSYNSLIPFEEGLSTTTNADYAAIAPHAVTGASAGPTASTSNVMCLSCHRAHASAWDSSLRFSYGNEFMTVADAAGVSIYPVNGTNNAQAMGRTVAEITAGYYQRPATLFAPYQRVLCNKCHAKD